MTGTSLDGIDAALIELPGWPEPGSGGAPPELTGAAPRALLLDHIQTPFAAGLRAGLLRACRDELRVSELAQLHVELGEALAAAAADLAAGADLIASHGQTVFHLPRLGEVSGTTTRTTFQIGEAACIAEASGKPVIADFRPADLVAGGQAAPLVPFADRIMYAEAGLRRSVHNLGGVSNLTYLPGLDPGGVLAFDTGPANALIDEVAQLAGQPFDAGGLLAAAGQVDSALVEAWLSDPYFSLPPPKSTGRERWTLRLMPGLPERLGRGMDLSDLAATVTAFSARSIVDAYRQRVLPLGLDEVLVAGGGAFNPVLMALIRSGLAPIPVLTFEQRGWKSSAREAAAFAVLGYYAYQGWPNTLPGTTGARHAVIAGKLSRPYRSDL